MSSEAGDGGGDVRAVWDKWSAILPPAKGGEWVASEGAVQDDRISAVHNNVHSGRG